MPRGIPKEKGDKPTQKPVSVSQSSITGNEPQKSGNEQIGSNQSNTHEKHSANPQIITTAEIPKNDVIEGVEANRIAKRANRISLAAVIVSSLLFVGTLVLVVQAIRQSKAAVDSVSLARQTYLADSIYKHNNDSLTKISDRIKKAREDSVFTLQIKALNTTRNQFEKINTPYITIKDASIGIVEGGLIGIGYDYYSTTGNTVQMVEINDTLVYIPNNLDKKFRKHPFSYVGFKYIHFKISDYLTKDSGNRQRHYPGIQAKNMLDKEVLKQGKIYFLVKDIYKNPINDKKRMFECVIECHQLPQDTHNSSYNIVYQKNYDL